MLWKYTKGGNEYELKTGSIFSKHRHIMLKNGELFHSSNSSQELLDKVAADTNQQRVSCGDYYWIGH
jgi:hypothetical protein